ncbi:unnamed protein product [Sphacelaria rigidula]
MNLSPLPFSPSKVYFPRRKESPPHGYNRLEFSPSGNLADINAGSGGAPVFLAYKQDLVWLKALRSGLSYA